MNIKQQRAALAKLNPQAKVASSTDTSWRDTVVNAVGATPIAVTSFFGDIKTSYKYHKAVREGQLK